MTAPTKHNAAWCRENPSQASIDLDRMSMAIKEALKLLRAGDPAEATIWLHNASQI